MRETSRISPFEAVRHPVQTVKKLQKKPEDVLDGVVLHPKVEGRVRYTSNDCILFAYHVHILSTICQVL